MESNGLKISIIEKITVRLAVAEYARNDAEHSPERKSYSAILNGISKQFQEAMNNKDYDTLFSLEETCQKHDAEFLNLDKEKAVRCFENLQSLKKLFYEGKDANKVRQRFDPTLETLKAAGTRVRDNQFEAGIRSISRIIGGCVGARSNFAEKNFYETRQNALLFIKKDHQQDLDSAYGYERKKANVKEKEQDISR